MKVLIVGILVLALGVAGVSTYLIKSFRTPEAIEQLEKEKAVPKKFVLVAERNKAMGETMTPEDMAWQPWVDEAVRPEYVVRQEAGPESGEEGDLMQPYIGALVRFPIAAGEPIVADKLFRRENPGFLAGALAAGMRAATIRVNEENGVAGFVFPGDRVDILLTHNLAPQVVSRQESGQPGAPSVPSPENVLNWTTETILTDLKVLGIGQQVDGFDNKAKIVPTVTLEVTPEQARALTVATSLGRMSLSLRPLADAGAALASGAKSFTTDMEVSPFLSRQMDERRAEAERRAAAAAAALFRDDSPRRVSAGPVQPAMTIFRGGSRSTEEVRK